MLIKTKGASFTIFIVLLILISLTQLNCQEKMEDKTNFAYHVSVTAPKEYPVEVHIGYLSKGKDFITGISNTGAAAGGWQYEGKSSMGSSTIPAFLSLTWLSYAEKKFWIVETELPAEKMLALFRKGYIYKNLRKGGVIEPETYNQIIIGTAPGGVVVVWLAGLERVEIGRFQAKEIYVNKLDFQPVKFEDETQQQFFDTWFKLGVPKETQANIQQKGIPYGLWDKYRQKYNWRFRTEFYREDKDKDVCRSITYFNGEKEVLFEEDFEKNSFMEQALPMRTQLTFREYNAEIAFDEKEIFDAFKQYKPNENIEIIAKPTFMYKGLTLTLKSKDIEIPLTKIKVNMWKNLQTYK